MNRTIGTAVIGVGIYGRTHVSAYKKNPKTKLLSVWSRSEKRAREIGERFDCPYTTDINEIARNEEIRIVSVATPDFAHAAPASMMLRENKNVLIEKPMATSSADCETILAAGRGSKGKIMINFHNRWYPPIVKAKELISAGYLGDILSVFARLSDSIAVPTEMLAWSSKSGPHWFLFPHTIDLIRWLIQQEPRKVYAQGKKGVLKKKGIDTYDIVQANVEFENTIATFESSWVIPKSWRNDLIEFSIDIYGEKGSVKIEGDKEGIEVSGDSYRTPLVYDFVTEEYPVNYFVDCVLNDREPEPNGNDGMVVTRTIEAVVNSLHSGKTVAL